MPKFLMYGAGSVGRGFIGPLFAHAGYEVAFVDINPDIVRALNERRGYHYTIVAETPVYVPVSGVRGVDGLDETAVVGEIAACDMMATALGASVLQKVAPLIARGFSARMRQSGRPLNILICENLKGAAHHLRGWLEAALPEGDRALLAQKCGLIETAIGRMIPVAAPNTEDPLNVMVEEYGLLPVDRDAFVGAPPDVANLIPYAPFAFFEERKLYMHNMGHAICGYLGAGRGYATIAEAIADPHVRLFTQSAMTESAAMLSAKYAVPFGGVFDHAEDLLLRFGNAALGDTCERVCRDPMRKLAAGDRLAGAMRECRAHGIFPVYIELGYAAALRYVTDNAGEAEAIARDTGGLDGEHTALVMDLFAAIERPMPELLLLAEKVKKGMRGSIV
ncbi:MAG: mannitol dehydrogenase [Oscillospiraceae bacterium]|nr:mannitol dehydrogenase [Oscillospiraceae bacterium]